MRSILTMSIAAAAFALCVAPLSAAPSRGVVQPNFTPIKHLAQYGTDSGHQCPYGQKWQCWYSYGQQQCGCK
jgi:hypothetical protein